MDLKGVVLNSGIDNPFSDLEWRLLSMQLFADLCENFQSLVDTSACSAVHCPRFRWRSSVGRAIGSYPIGQGFKSLRHYPCPSFWDGATPGAAAV